MHGPTCIFWANLTPFSLQVEVDDLWEHTGKAATGSLEVTIFAHDTKMLQLTQN